MFELTEEQRRELNQPEPLAVNPETQKTYILVPRDVYDRMKSLLATDEYDPDEGMALLNEALADDDAGDPLLEGYQQYGKPT